MLHSTRKPTVLITGASRGLGKGIAHEYASRGYDVMISARDESALLAVRDSIRSRGSRAECVICDVTDEQQIKLAVQTTLTVFGRIDIAILNAGISNRVVFNDLILEDYRAVMTTNLFAVLAFIAELVPIMRVQGAGIIVGVSSLLDSRSIPGVSAYTASKAALSHSLECAAIELKPHNIHVVNVRPGFIRTDMTANNKVRMPFLMSVDRAARIIVNGIEKGKHVISFPWPMTLFSTIMKVLPGSFWKWRFRIQR